jgi:hypothetical protein
MGPRIFHIVLDRWQYQNPPSRTVIVFAVAIDVMPSVVVVIASHGCVITLYSVISYLVIALYRIIAGIF